MRTDSVTPNRRVGRRAQLLARNFLGSLLRGLWLLGLAGALCGCQELTYAGPNGERFMRFCLGTVTAVGSLSIDAGTNGVRRVELRNYQNDANQALGTVTEAAVRAALQGAK